MAKTITLTIIPLTTFPRVNYFIISTRGAINREQCISDRTLVEVRQFRINMADYFQIFSGIVLAFLALYYYLSSIYDYWKIRGVPGPQPIFGFGNIKDVLFRKMSLGDYITKYYREYKDETMFGMFMNRMPCVVLRDLDLIKDVLVKDFSKFDSRGNATPERAEPLSVNIFNLEAARWRPLRSRLSPVFTSGKMKEMFPLILECSNELEQCLEKVAAKGEPLECRELAARFTTDVIGSCAFGINMNALSNEQSVFRRMGKKVFSEDPKTVAWRNFREAVPQLYNILGYVMPYSETTKFVTQVIADTIEYRERNNVVRPDFINMLMELKKHPDKLENIDLTDTLLAAQAFVFFVAGFETSSTTIGHALYEMALNPELQDKLREEIKEVCVKNNGNLMYDDIKEMRYLDKIFKETLRKYPPGQQLRRQCNSTYTFNGTKISITKEAKVFIPVYAIHTDPNIYPNPDIFDPDRFNEDAVAARHPMSYLPFGDGPRNCIGARFAVYQTKVGLIKMLRNFKVEVCEKTMIPYETEPGSLTMSPKRGIYLKVVKVGN